MNILIHGIGGKMGKTLFAVLKERKDARAVCGVDKFADPAAFQGLPVYKSLDEVKETADCIIDFSVKDAVYAILPYAAARNIPCVLATTGYGDEETAFINSYAGKIPVFRSGNMSIGINVVTELIVAAAKLLGERADIEIIEAHHNQKVDAPSGTALMLLDAVKKERENLSPAYGRQGITGKRPKDEVGMHSVRGGTIIGKHEVMFILDNEVITVKHEAESRAMLAVGSVNAALFIKDKAPGIYGMDDLLNKKNK